MPRHVHREDPEVTAIHERAAHVLGWSLKEVQRNSMPNLREAVRGRDPQLVRAMDLWIREGHGILPKPRVGSQRIPGRVPQWMLDDQTKFAAEDAAAKAKKNPAKAKVLHYLGAAPWGNSKKLDYQFEVSIPSAWHRRGLTKVTVGVQAPPGTDPKSLHAEVLRDVAQMPRYKNPKVPRGAGVNARGGWQHVTGSGVWLAKYASGPSFQIVKDGGLYALDQGRWSAKANSFKSSISLGRYKTLSEAQMAASSARSKYRLNKSNPRVGAARFGRQRNPALTPVNRPGDRLEGTIHLPLAKIARAIGFAPNVEDDPDKVEASWGFRDAQGREGFVWCYGEPARTCRKWSCSGSRALLHDLFGDALHWRSGNPKKNPEPKRKKNPDYDLDVGKVHIQTSKGVPGIPAGILAAGFNNDAAAPAILKKAFVAYTGRPPKGYIDVTFIVEGGDALNSANLPIEPTFTAALAERIVAKLSMRRDPVVQWEKR